tara:strand:+ start:215 stop:607 length:393 start_codon:yes stop_codon:yes gene_type:complete
MAFGLAPKLTLELNSEDGAYGLLKSLAGVAKQNLKMVVLTSPGERIMEPEFGVGLKRYLFELATIGLEQTIRQRISDQVSKYLPYVRMNNIIVQTSRTNPDVPDNYLFVRLEYSVPSARVSQQTLDIKVS